MFSSLVLPVLRAYALAGKRSAAQTFDKRYLPAWLSAMISLAASTRFLSEGNVSSSRQVLRPQPVLPGP